MNPKTIKELNQKAWYRLLKVIYILSSIFVVCVGLVFVTEEVLVEGYIVLGLVLYVLCPIFIYTGFEIIRRLFFYVILGRIKPSDDNYFIRLKKHKKLIIAISIILIIAFAYGIWDANQIDRHWHLRANPSVTIPNIDLPEFPSIKIPSISPSIKIPSIPLL